MAFKESNMNHKYLRYYIGCKCDIGKSRPILPRDGVLLLQSVDVACMQSRVGWYYPDYSDTCTHSDSIYMSLKVDLPKPIIHRLIDMDEETAMGLVAFKKDLERYPVFDIEVHDCEQFHAIGFYYQDSKVYDCIRTSELSSEQIEYLLGGNPQGKYFDLWNLIDSGDAIDAKNYQL